MLPRDEAALALYQSHKRHPEIEALLDEFFGRITAAQYEEQLRKVLEEMSSCVITNSPSSSQSLEASSLVA